MVIFYADDGRLASYVTTELQQSIDLFADLFSRFGLFINPSKTKAMTSFGSVPYIGISSSAYKRKFDSSLPSYRQRKLRKVQCSLCHKSMTEQYLPIHRRHIHGIIQPPSSIERLSRASAAREYWVLIPEQGIPTSCPIRLCPAKPATRGAMREHFARLHPSDVIVVVEEGRLPQCPRCGRFTNSVGPSHFSSRACKQLFARRTATEQVKAQVAERKAKFRVGKTPIESVDQFKYLGRILTADDHDDLAVRACIAKARKQWMQIFRILSYDNATPRTMGRFYLAVVQSVLLYGSESWVLDSCLKQRLESFHKRCARYIAHRHIRRRRDGTWQYPDTQETYDICNFSPISTYIAKRKSTLLHRYAEKISPSFRQCIDPSFVPAPTARHRLLWWS